MRFTRIRIVSGTPSPSAYLRDTHVTVADIVRLAADGMSHEDILAQFAELEEADIGEALAFAAVVIESGFPSDGDAAQKEREMIGSTGAKLAGEIVARDDFGDWERPRG